MITKQADRRQAIAEMRANRDLLDRARADDFQHAAHVADLYSEVDEPTYLLPGAEKLLQMAHDGTPAVAEFCTLEVAAALGVSDTSVVGLMVDALDVRHRLPRLWVLVDELRVQVWQAREVARLTAPLTREACSELDERLAGVIGGMSWSRVRALVEGWVLELLPPAAQEERRALAADRRHVTIAQSHDGVTACEAVVDAADGVLLEAQVSRLASILLDGGQRGSLDERRARALGLLANPALSLQLLQASLLDELPADPDDFEACVRAGGAGHTCGTIDVDPERLLPEAQVVVHLTDLTLAEGEGLVRTNTLGPLLADWTSQLLGHQRVSVRPVIDANRTASSDAYEAPWTMREAVRLRNTHEVFPWSSRRASGCDLDHTVAYLRGGPPGQTRPDNLGPLSRKVHRAKTHGGWRVEQPWPGVFCWTSPLGQRHLVTRSHTITLDPPAAVHHQVHSTAA